MNLDIIYDNIHFKILKFKCQNDLQIRTDEVVFIKKK
jgi:hypothetical protein